MKQAVLQLSSLRVKRSQRVSHAAAGAGMLMLGIESLTGGQSESLLKPILEILAGTALLVVVAIETRQARKGIHHSKFDWADFFAGIVAIVEGIGRIHHGDFWHSRLTFVWFFLAALFFVKGIYISKLPKWSRLILTEKNFTRQKPFFRRKSAAWSDVQDIQISDDLIVLETGQSPWLKIDLKEYEHPAAIAQWCREQIPGFWQKPNSK